MAVDLDDLFKGGAAAPPPDPRPSLRRMARVGVMGHVLGVFAGMGAMLTSQASQGLASAPDLAAAGGYVVLVLFIGYLAVVPCTLLSLYTWHRAGEELDRVKRGILPREWATELRITRKALLAWLAVAGVSMMIQTAALGWLAAGGTH